MTAGYGPQVARPTGGRIQWANDLRGLAAFAVVMHHLALSFYLAPGIVAYVTGTPQQNLPLPLLARVMHRIPFDFGAFGVCLFFIISGFVISRSLVKYNRTGFLIGRSMRLLPTYAVGFIGLSIVVWINQRIATGTSSVTVLGTLVGSIPGLSTLTGVPTVLNGVVWTLIVEIAFYAICLVLFRQLVTRWWLPPVLAIGCVAVQAVFRHQSWGVTDVVDRGFARPEATPGAESAGDTVTAIIGGLLPGVAQLVMLVVPYLPILMIGVVLARAHGRTNTRSAGVTAFLFLCFAWMVQFSPLYYFDTTWVIRFTYLVTIIGCLMVAAWSTKWTGNRVASFFADISYPTYVLHMLLGWTVLYYLTSAGVNSYLSLLAAIGLVIAVAWVLHVTVEVPSHRLGRRWARTVTQADPGGGDTPATHDQGAGSNR